MFDTMIWVGETWKNAMTFDPVWHGNPVCGPGFGNGFQNRQLASNAECYLGKSKPQGYQRAPCQSGGAVLLEHLVTIAATVTVAGLATKHGGIKQLSLLSIYV